MAKKRYIPKLKNGTEAIVRTTTDDILIDNTTTLTQSIENTINRLKDFKETDMHYSEIVFDNNGYQTATEYKRNTILTHKGQKFISKIPTSIEPKHKSAHSETDWVSISKRKEPICVFSVVYDSVTRNHSVESDYGYTLNDISSMLQNNKCEGYIQNGDYVELWSDSDNKIYKMIMNINTYKNIHDISMAPNCIDLICHEVRPQGQNILPEHSISFPNLGNNPKINTGITPIVVSKFINDLTLNRAIEEDFGVEFRSHITPKFKSVVTRNVNIKDIEADSNKKDYSVIEEYVLGLSWLLYEFEIIGKSIYSSANDAMLCTQYPMFKNPEMRSIIYDNKRYGILTSSLVDNSIFKPVLINKYGDPIYINGDFPSSGYYPMFGLRFL